MSESGSLLFIRFWNETLITILKHLRQKVRAVLSLRHFLNCFIDAFDSIRTIDLRFDEKLLGLRRVAFDDPGIAEKWRVIHVLSGSGIARNGPSKSIKNLIGNKDPNRHCV